jgi:hypothetical protein
MTRAYSLHIDDDVAPILDQHKKRAGRGDTRGKYVSRAIRAYEDILEEDRGSKLELEHAKKELNDMREIARKFASRMHHYIELFQWTLNNKDGFSPRPQWDEGKLWFAGDNAVKAALEDLLEERLESLQRQKEAGPDEY